MKLTLAFLIIAQTIPASASNAGPGGLNVVTYNVFARPAVVSSDGQIERMARLPAGLDYIDLAHGTVDVIVLQEAFIKAAHGGLAAALASRGFRYTAGPDIGWPHVVNGGVMLLSRWPIGARGERVFGDCVHSDCLAAKGVIYARIDKPGQPPVHVFGTHLQAWNDSRARDTRLAQARHMAHFIAEQALPTDAPFVVVGDLNTADDAEVAAMTSILGVRRPAMAGAQRWSVDPMSNALVGRDGSAAAGGCRDSYERLGYCGCCEPLWLDWALPSAAFAQAELRAIPLKAAPFSVQWDGHERSITDLSDHYPVMARLTLAQPVR